VALDGAGGRDSWPARQHEATAQHARSQSLRWDLAARARQVARARARCQRATASRRSRWPISLRASRRSTRGYGPRRADRALPCRRLRRGCPAEHVHGTAVLLSIVDRRTAKLRELALSRVRHLQCLLQRLISLCLGGHHIAPPPPGAQGEVKMVARQRLLLAVFLESSSRVNASQRVASEQPRPACPSNQVDHPNLKL
jgi:hypothetical protein